MSEQKKEGLSIRGKVMLVLPEETITKKDGTTLIKKQFVIETTTDQYPKKVSFQAISDKVNVPKIGTVCDVYFNIESREYQGRWYSQVTCWKIWEERSNNSAPSNTPSEPNHYPQQPHETNFTSDVDDNDTLPF